MWKWMACFAATDYWSLTVGGETGNLGSGDGTIRSSWTAKGPNARETHRT
jgi:hypothetical protein